MALDRLEPREAKTSDQDMLSMAVSSKAALDSAVRIAVEKAQRDVGVETFTCYLCGKLKKRGDFYTSSDSKSNTGVTRVCRECAKKIAHGSYDDGITKEPTAESIRDALSYVDVPWRYSVYQSAIQTCQESDMDIWDQYLHIHALTEGNKERFIDSEDLDPAATVNAESGKDVAEEEYEYNRRDVVRMIGYDPFEYYPVEADKPQLYAQLISFIDDDTRNDGMKLGAVIQIVKKLNQVEKINNQIDLYVNDTKNVAKNMALIEKMSSSSQKLMQVANALAKDNGISANFNQNRSAGASTLSGKMKKLSEIGFRNAKINAFDIGTCEGMRQVAEISEAARHKRIGYDENIAAEIKDIKVELVESATKEKNAAVERARKLMVENKDLKDYLRAKGLMDDAGRLTTNE